MPAGAQIRPQMRPHFHSSERSKSLSNLNDKRLFENHDPAARPRPRYGIATAISFARRAAYGRVATLHQRPGQESLMEHQKGVK